MPIYPYNSDIKEAAGNMNKGNFGLWYNKFIPVADTASKKPYKACDNKGIPDNAAEFYARQYSMINKADIQSLLTEKHINQADFCTSFESAYDKVVFKAKLITPLITGIGESHPHEVSMVFDHNMGIPYIPSSGIKGIVRFAHTLGLIDEIPQEKIIKEKNGKPCGPYFDDEYDGEDWKTYVKELFGTQKNRGSVIFLDAYPENVPELHVDIMNPHYGEYYSDDSEIKPPADYLNPIPLKFLTVARGTTFIFRALVDKKITGLTEKVKSALRNAMCEEGIGAKTAIGHGLFELIHDVNQIKAISDAPPEKEEKMVDKFISEIKRLKPNDAGQICSKIDQALNKLEAEDDKRKLAIAVKEYLGQGFKKSKARERLKNFLR